MLIDARNHVSTFTIRYTVNRVIRKTLNNTQFVAFHRNICQLIEGNDGNQRD